MKITILCGSPRARSCTKQYAIYLEKKHKEHTFDLIDVGGKIKKIEKDDELFNEIINSVRESDGVLWATPVFYGNIPAQFMRFIEMIFERNAADAFEGKYSAHLSTSVHIGDNMVAEYINAISDDLGMKYICCCPSYMKAIDHPEMMEKLENFMNYVLDNMENKRVTLKNFNKSEYKPIEYKPQKHFDKLTLGGKKLVILYDSTSNQNVNNMIQAVKDNFAEEIECVNIGQKELISDGCVGCFLCSYDYSKCVYDKVDNYRKFYIEHIYTADAIIFAGEIKYRYLSSDWKKFFDRSFFHNHTPSLTDKQLIFMVSGNLKENPHITNMFSVFSQYQDSNLLQVLNDEYEDSESLDNVIRGVCENIAYATKNAYVNDRNFLGTGARRLLRDEIYGELRYPFIEDYRIFKKSKQFDYPTKRVLLNLINNILKFMVTLKPELHDRILSNPDGMPFYKRLKAAVEKAE